MSFVKCLSTYSVDFHVQGSLLLFLSIPHRSLCFNSTNMVASLLSHLSSPFYPIVYIALVFYVVRVSIMIVPVIAFNTFFSLVHSKFLVKGVSDWTFGCLVYSEFHILQSMHIYLLFHTSIRQPYIIADLLTGPFGLLYLIFPTC